MYVFYLPQYGLCSFVTRNAFRVLFPMKYWSALYPICWHVP